MGIDTERALQQQVADLQRENAELKARVKAATPLAPIELPSHSPTPSPMPSPMAAPTPSPVRSYKGLRALVVEDHRVNQLLARHLLQLLGFEVDVADDGEPGVQAVQTGRFDLVLMDLQMPDMDGWEATRQIRQWEQGQAKTRVPIIALTATPEAHPQSAGRTPSPSMEMDGYLTKPLTQQALQAALLTTSLGLAAQALSPVGSPVGNPDSSRDLSRDISPQSSPVDRQRMLARLGQDEAALRDMVKAFCIDLRQCLNQAWQGLQSQEWALVSAQAHALRGLLSSMTAEAAAADARALELAARAGDPDGIKAAFSKLSESARQAFDAVRSW